MPECATIRIKSSHPASQGDFVEINKGDFNTEKHEMYVPPVVAPVIVAPPVIVPPPPPVDPLANLPKDWRETMKVPAMRTLAEAVSGGRTPENKEQAVAMISAALAARG